MEQKALVNAVVEAVEPVVDEKMATLQSEMNEKFATKEDIVAMVGNKTVSKDEEVAQAQEKFASMLKAIKNGDVAQVKALNEGTPADGGYLVHPEFEKGVFKVMEDYGVFKDCKIIPMAGNTKYITRRLQGVEVFYTDEATAYSNTEMTFDQIELIARKIGAILPATYELIEDNSTGEDIWTQAQAEFAVAMAQFIDTEVLTGTATGASKIKGITNLADVNVVALTGNATTLTHAKLIDLVRSVPLKFQKTGKAKFYMDQSLIAVVEKLVDDNNRPLYRTLDDGSKSFLLGHEVVLTDVVAGAAAGVDTPVIVFGNLKNFALGLRKGMTMEFGYRTGDWEADIKSLKITKRVAGHSLADDSFAIVKTAA